MTRTGNAYYRRQRAQVLAHSDICWLCGKPGSDSTDHIVPVSQGGSDNASNLRPAHLECNKIRGVKDAADVNILRTSRDW